MELTTFKAKLSGSNKYIEEGKDNEVEGIFALFGNVF